MPPLAQVHPDLRTALHRARTLEGMAEIVAELNGRPPTTLVPFCSAPGDRYTPWYRRRTFDQHRVGARADEVAEAEENADAPWIDLHRLLDGGADAETA